MATNIITVKELWDDPTGEHCAEIRIDGRNVASVYSRAIERILLGTLVDQHCEVRREISWSLKAARRRRESRMTGADLKSAIDELGFTQAEFARWLGRHIQTVSNWCRDVYDIPREVEIIIGLIRETRDLRQRVGQSAG